jgi:hypothetical protein
VLHTAPCPILAFTANECWTSRLYCVHDGSHGSDTSCDSRNRTAATGTPRIIRLLQPALDTVRPFWPSGLLIDRTFILRTLSHPFQVQDRTLGRTAPRQQQLIQSRNALLSTEHEG